MGLFMRLMPGKWNSIELVEYIFFFHYTVHYDLIMTFSPQALDVN